MKDKFKQSLLGIISIAGFLMVGLVTEPVHAQLKEPEVLPIEQPRTPLSAGLKNGLTFNITINNFGFGIGGQYSHELSPFTEVIFNTGITGIRDVSEQSFQDYFSGQRIVPNKYNRAIAFPFMVGLKHRLFAREIEDNFRFFVSSSAGPVMAFVYPYFKDSDNNGYRTYIPAEIYPGYVALVPNERVNDFFSGWKNGSTKWGAAGELKVGIDFGSNFKKLTTIEFGYLFYYFNQGIQMMEPMRPTGYDQDGNVTGEEPFFDKKKYFGTPEITIKFGGMW